MATGPMGDVLRQLSKSVLALDGGDLTDGHLLRCFVEQRDEAAFEALVRRHGPMVLGVCRRVLSHAQDAEDAFQAAFLVLARKADSISPPDMVGNWLYGVAYRTALKARTANARRRTTERQVPEMARPEPATETWRELRPLLDQELDRLPDKLRVPVVLCDLEGKSRKEAARQLGWPEGTLSWRLAAARTQLAKRLARRGLALSAGSLALVLPENGSPAVPAALVASTVQAAALSAAGQAVAAGLISTQVAALTEGVLRTMWLTKLKIVAAAALAVAVIGTGLGVVSYRTLAGPAERQAAPAAERNQASAPREDLVLAEQERQRDERKPADFQGRIAAISADGKSLTVEGAAGRGEEPKKLEIKLTEQTKIELPPLLKDLGRKLRVGDWASVWLQPGSKDTAAVLQAQLTPDLNGKITALSGDGKVITVEVPSRERNAEPMKIEVKLTKETQTEYPRGDAEKQPQAGLFASVWLQQGSKDTAAALQVRRPNPDAAGEITAISADGKALTLRSRNRSGEATKVEVKLAANTKIEAFTDARGGASVGEDKKLKLGYQVLVWLQPGSQDTAATVQFAGGRRGPDVQGRISALSADGKLITLEVQRRGEDPTTTQIKLTDKSTVEFSGTEKEEEKKLTVGYQGAVWLQEGSKDTAAIFEASKPRERGR